MLQIALVKLTSYTYDATSQLASKKLPNQATSDYQYDNLGQLIELKHSNQRGKVLEHFLYSYNPVGNRIQTERVTDGNDEDDLDGNEQKESLITQYAHDALNQLTEVHYL